MLLVAGTLATPPDWALLCGAMGQLDDAGAMQRRTVDCATLADGPWDTALLAERLHQALEHALAA